MIAMDVIWDFAEDHYGIITTAQAVELGVDKHILPAMAQRGTLIKKAYGVYLVRRHVPRENDVYAHSVAVAGASAYLRGASVVALLKLAPTRPAIIYVGAELRVRRQLPKGIRLVDMRKCECVEYEGIRCQSVVEALRTAKKEGQMEYDRIAVAAQAAAAKGLISDAESAEFQI